MFNASIIYFVIPFMNQAFYSPFFFIRSFLILFFIPVLLILRFTYLHLIHLSFTVTESEEKREREFNLHEKVKRKIHRDILQ